MVTAHQPLSISIKTILTPSSQTLILEKELKVVIDCGNGVAGNIAPQTL